MNFTVNKEFILNKAKELLEFHSPTGFCFEIMELIEGYAKDFGYSFERTNKGNGIITIEGKSDERVIGLAAHVDTLGLMVRSIKEDGTLAFTLVGGPIV